MIREEHSKAWTRFLDYYSRWLMKRHFRSIRYCGDVKDRGKPVLIISNHFSWYDGFIQYHLNKRFLGKRFHVMMLEEQLRNYPFLQKVGAFSVQKKSRDIIKSLNHAVEILQNPHNMLLLFPQGEIQTLYTHNFKFEKGLDFILKKVGDVQIIFNINLVDYFSHKKPELSVYFQEYSESALYTFDDLCAAFDRFAHECKSRQVEE
jgi:1-acyl-sn-glycerol-3-phosphate acyltransferase